MNIKAHDVPVPSSISPLDVDSRWPMRCGGYYILCIDPTIAVCLGEYQPLPYGTAPPLPKNVRFDAIIEHLSHYCGGGGLIHVAQRYDKQSGDGIRRLVSVNTNDEETSRRNLGIDGFQGNENVYAREDIFVVRLVPAHHDAVYVARPIPCKRIHLVSGIGKVRLLASGVGDVSILDSVAKKVDLELRTLSPPEVASEVSRAICGLALSDVEGVMRANTEYLLCGKPVVTTPSRGGRDMLYDDYNSICVQPDEQAIADAVEVLKKYPRDPERIRRNAVQRLTSWRYRYCRRLTELRRELAGAEITPEQFYYNTFIDRVGFNNRFIVAGAKTQPSIDPSWFSTREIDFRLREAFTLSQVDDAYELYEAKRLRATLSATAAHVAHLCSGGCTLPDLVDTLATHYGRHPDMPEQVREALQSLIDLGAVAVAAAGG